MSRQKNKARAAGWLLWLYELGFGIGVKAYIREQILIHKSIDKLLVMKYRIRGRLEVEGEVF